MRIDLDDGYRRPVFQRPDRQGGDGIVAAEHDRNGATLAQLADCCDGVAGIAMDIAPNRDDIAAIQDAQSEIGKSAAEVEVVMIQHAAETE